MLNGLLLKSNWYIRFAKKLAPITHIPTFFNHQYRLEYKLALLPHICIESHHILWLRKHCRITMYYRVSMIPGRSKHVNKIVHWMDMEIAMQHIISQSGRFDGRGKVFDIDDYL